MVYKNLNNDNYLILKCDCIGECGGIEFVLDEDEEAVYVSVQPEGYNALHELSLLGRLKQAFKIIFKYKCYYDNIFLNKNTFQTFINEVNIINNRLNSKEGD